MRTLARETCVTDTLNKGKYRIVTHDTVLRRLIKSPNLAIHRCDPAYQSDLKQILSAMTDGQCKHCTKQCRAWHSPPRQFYYVKFKINKI